MSKIFLSPQSFDYVLLVHAKASFPFGDGISLPRLLAVSIQSSTIT
jgi:hypothetical protein